MRKARAIKKLNKQLRPLPLPKVPKTVNKRQRLLAVLKICFHSSKPQLLAASGSLKGGPRSAGTQADRSSHATKSRPVESDNVQNLPLPHGLGFGGCQLGQGHTQWSNRKESGTSLMMQLIGICLPMQ